LKTLFVLVLTLMGSFSFAGTDESVFASVLTASRTLSCESDDALVLVRIRLEVRAHDQTLVTLLTSSGRQPSQALAVQPQVLVGQDVADDLVKSGTAALAFDSASLSLRNGRGMVALASPDVDSEQVFAVSHCQ